MIINHVLSKLEMYTSSQSVLCSLHTKPGNSLLISLKPEV